ncbi:MAG TPA: acyl-CoA carboxylase subunit epsilon [Pseudonocardiaceae bacterium]
MSGSDTNKPTGTAATSGEAAADPESKRPVLRIVRGEPDDVEIAALTAVLTSIAASAVHRRQNTETAAARSHWADKPTLARRPLVPGPGAWRASGLPH